jgi:glycosyltransferase involved in cell wall biosynthesis
VTRPLRIALTHVYCWPEVRRGAERYVHELAAALIRAGHHVEFFSSDVTPSRDVVLGVTVRRLKRRWGLHPWFGALADHVAFGVQSLGVVPLRRFDVWHAVSTGDGAAAALASAVRPGLRSVYTEAGFPWRCFRDERSDHRLYDFLIAHVDELVCLSEPAARAAQQDYGRRAHVVPGGVDLATFHGDGPREPNPVLLFPGSLEEPRKNIALLLEAAALLRDRGLSFEVWLVGPGELPTDLSELARRGLGAVTVLRTAASDELPSLFRSAWVTVLPSESEVFGLVVLESLATGTPAVVLNDGLGPASLVTEATGVTTEATAHALAEACAKAIDLARDPATAAACRTSAEAYDWDTVVVPALLRVYRG